MDAISQFFHSILTTEGLHDLIAKGGYLALFLIIFSETGLLIGFFLPGDSLLVTAGLLIASGVVEMNIVTLNILLMIAAVLGDAVGFYIGHTSGKKLYSRPDSRFFKQEHLRRTHAFYEKHGGKTIIFARFIPVVRTFAPIVAGAAQMHYRKFATFNVVGGILWILATTMLGYGLGRVIPNIEHYLHYVIGIVILLSILPPIIEWLRNRNKPQAKGAEASLGSDQKIA